MSEDPHIRLAKLDDVTSGLTANPLRSKLYTYTTSDRLSRKMAGKCKPQHLPCPWKKWRENLGSPLSASLCKAFEELMRGHRGGDEETWGVDNELMSRQWVALLAYYRDLFWDVGSDCISSWSLLIFLLYLPYKIIYLNATPSANKSGRRGMLLAQRNAWRLRVVVSFDEESDKVFQ